jgi:hypothetical protein
MRPARSLVVAVRFSLDKFSGAWVYRLGTYDFFPHCYVVVARKDSGDGSFWADPDDKHFWPRTGRFWLKERWPEFTIYRARVYPNGPGDACSYGAGSGAPIANVAKCRASHIRYRA